MYEIETENIHWVSSYSPFANILQIGVIYCFKQHIKHNRFDHMAPTMLKIF